MSRLETIFRFGWPYLRRYWGRFIAGLLLGIVFGLSNASFVWATKTLIGRMAPPAQQEAQRPALKTPGPLTELGGASQASPNAIDPWLPYKGRPADWRQIVADCSSCRCSAIRGVAGYLNSYCMAWVSERRHDLRVDVLEKLSTLSWISSIARTGDLLARVNQDTAACKVLEPGVRG